MTDLVTWMGAATPEEIKRLAKAANTTPNYLRHMAAGRREPSAQMAGQIEKATREIEKGKHGLRLPAITRGEINIACAKCPYYKQCNAK